MIENLPRGWTWTHLSNQAEINSGFESNGKSANMAVSFVPMKCVEKQTGRIDIPNSKKLSEIRKGCA
jgi:hypothetical protein